MVLKKELYKKELIWEKNEIVQKFQALHFLRITPPPFFFFAF